MTDRFPPRAFVLIGIVLCFFTLTGSHGLIHYLQMGKELEDLQQRNGRLEAELAELGSRIAALQHSTFELERTAREELSLAGPDETVYIFSSD